MDGSSAYGSDFIVMKGDRVEAKRPQDFDFLKSNEPFIGQTQKQLDFRGGPGEIFDLKRPEASDIWKVGFFSIVCF